MPWMTISSAALAVVLALCGVPLAVALGISSLVVIWFGAPFALDIVPQLMAQTTDSFVLTAIPLFVLVGYLLDRGGLGNRLVTLSNAFVGWTRGGLGGVNVLASFIFGGLSGSSFADTVALGTVLIPRMKEEGYPVEYAAALTSVSSVLSSIVPPSILLVIWGAIAEQSIGALLIGGLIPGVLMALGMMAVNYYMARKHGYGTVNRFDPKKAWAAIRKGIPILGAPLIILAGIGTGFFTPTEAAGLAALYALVASFMLGELNIKDTWKALSDATRLCASVLFILAASAGISWILVWEQVPHQLVAWLMGLGLGAGPTIFLIIASLLVVGMFMDVVVALIIFTPLFLPLATSLGMDPVHFGVVMVSTLALGLTTPPVGGCLFSVAAISGVSAERISIASIPFYAVTILILAIMAFIPETVLFLPKAMMGH